MSDFSRLLEIARGNISPPVVVDTPALMVAGTENVITAAKVGDELSCTKGNWQNEPTGYGFGWRSSGNPVAGNGDRYVVQPSDRNGSIDCIVTASNAGGSAEAASNKINVSGAVEERRQA